MHHDHLLDRTVSGLIHHAGTLADDASFRTPQYLDKTRKGNQGELGMCSVSREKEQFDLLRSENIFLVK